MNFFSDYIFLFFLSFLASTIIPLGSEWLLIKMILENKDPYLSVIIATSGNFLGAVTTYYLGVFGSSFVIEKIFRMDENTVLKAKKRYKKYGSWTLLFSWLPVIGDPVCLAGGILGVRFHIFSFLVIAGKALRYAAVTYLTLKVI